MLDKILRTLKAKGRAYETSLKSDQKIWEIMRDVPGVTIAELMDALDMSESGVKKVIRQLKDANLIRRVGPDKGGHWEAVSVWPTCSNVAWGFLHD